MDLCTSSQQLLDNAHLMRVIYSRISIGTFSLIFFFSCFWFNFGSLSCLACFLVIQAVSVGPLLWPELQVGSINFITTIVPVQLAAELIVGRKFYGWVDVPVPLLGALSCYRRWLVQVLYPPLLGVFTKVPVIDSTDFQLLF